MLDAYQELGMDEWVGNWVTCVCTGNRPGTLTKGKKYQVLKVKPDGSCLRLKGDNDRHQWYQTSNFDLTGGTAVLLEKVHLQYPISNPLDDLIEVNLEFSDGSWRWCYCATPQYLVRLLASKMEVGRPTGDEVLQTSTGQLFSHIYFPEVIFLSSLSEESIWLTLKYMDDQGELQAASKPCYEVDWEEPEDSSDDA